MKDKIINVFKIVTGVRYRELKVEWEEQSAMIDHLTWERNEARTKLGYEKKRVSGLRDDIKKLKDDFANERAEYEERIHDLLTELARNDSELVEARVEIEELKKEINIKERVIEDLDTMLKQANSTDNVQPDCAEEDIPETPCGEDHDEMVVTEIECIPGEISIDQHSDGITLSSADLNLTYMPIDEGHGAYVVRGEKNEEAPKKKGRPRKSTTKTPKKSDIKKK